MNRYLLLLLLAMVPNACEPSDQINLKAAMNHVNGLVATPPEGFEANETESGFIFTEAGEMRSPREIRLELELEPPEMINAESREIAGEPVSYAVRELGPGSGGTEYELTAVRSVGTRYIVLTAFEQSEIAEPYFGAAWATLERAAVE